MSLKISVKDKDVEAYIKSITNDLKKNITDDLDKNLDRAIEELKLELKGIINSEVEQTKLKTQDNKIQSVSFPKNETEILSEITNSDFSKINTIKDYKGLIDSKIALVIDKQYRLQQNMEITTSRMSSGVNFRIDMSSYDTFESQYSQATKYFNEAVFAFETNGVIEYYLNPGIDLTPYVKVVCSNEAGDTDRSRKRFQKLRDGSSRQNNKGEWADWTLLASGVDLVKAKFIKLNNVVNQIKNSDFETATQILNRIPQKSAQISKAIEGIQNISLSTNIKPNTQAYFNLLNIIINLKIRKRISKYKTTYSLISKFSTAKGEIEKKEDNFMDMLKVHIYIWKVKNEPKLIKTIESAIERTIKKY